MRMLRGLLSVLPAGHGHGHGGRLGPGESPWHTDPQEAARLLAR